MKTIFSFFLCLVCLSCETNNNPSPNYKNEIIVTINSLNKDIENGNFEKVVDYYPKSFFSLYSKESLIEGFSSYKKNFPNSDMRLLPIVLIDISDLFFFKAQSYCKIRYYEKFSLHFDKEIEKDFQFLQMIYGTNNVQIDKEKNIIQIKKEAIKLALKDNTESGWKLFGINENKAGNEILRKLLPNEVSNHFQF